MTTKGGIQGGASQSKTEVDEFGATTAGWSSALGFIILGAVLQVWYSLGTSPPSRVKSRKNEKTDSDGAQCEYFIQT